MSLSTHASRCKRVRVRECMEYRQFEAPDLLPYFTREEAEQLGLDGYKN
jgi:hypothetical protein